ncbi:hypothetical protein AB2L57_10685 [Microbacterium sp. HA-8]|uniref:hypothetical protein n=1 Tax=Microbacterium sp. HA-8 TaxID=3234200 RepID=UPI0038F6A952
MNPPLCTPEQAASLGYEASAPMLARASVRIRSYAGDAFIDAVSTEDWLIELTAGVAQRLAGIEGSALAQGITSEGAGGETVSYGADAWAGVSGLTRGEERVIDAQKRRRRGIRVIHLVA